MGLLKLFGVKFNATGKLGDLSTQPFFLIDQENLFVSELSSKMQQFSSDHIHINEDGGYRYYRAYYSKVVKQISKQQLEYDRW